MKNKLLNFSKNLIITLGLVVIIFTVFFTTNSYAAQGDTLGKLMRQNISSWYRVILRISISAYVIGYLIILIKLLAYRTPERIKTVKESLLRFFVMFAIIYFLHVIMIAIMSINTEGINLAKKIGTMFSGINMSTDENDLYETALSKAYELSMVPGFIGLIMYALIVFYTYRFVFVYAKRYINIVILILIAPVIFVMSTLKQIIFGTKDDKIKKWIKEFIFNVILQTLHAIYYSTIIGFTISLTQNSNNLVMALITLILFGFIFKIDGIIRKLFNIVGGSTNIGSIASKTSKTVELTSSGINTLKSGLENTVHATGEVKDNFVSGISNAKDKFTSGAISFGQSIADNGFGSTLKSTAVSGYQSAKVKFKKMPDQLSEAIAKPTKKNAQNISEVLNGDRVKNNLTAEEVMRQAHIMQEGNNLEGLRQKVRKVIFFC